MNYFEFLLRLRQAVFYYAVLFILTVSTQSFAQEIAEIDKIEETKKTTRTVVLTETQTANDTQKFTAETLTAETFTRSFKPGNERFRDSSFSNRTEKKQQSPDDDTMMGVMGESGEKSRFGGHVGFVVPIVGRGGGVTTNVGDRFVFGFPVGLTVKTKSNLAVDFEFIPTFNTGRDFVLTIHPGIIYDFKKKYAVGVRAAYDAGAGSYGFTPLISRGFKINEKVGFFIEADFPIRSNYRAYQDRFGSIAFAMHAGFAF